MMPTPPSHCICWRYHNTDFGSPSSPLMTVAPVVVKPDTASNMAPAKSSAGRLANTSGKAPATPMTTQNKVTSTKPSRNRKSRTSLR